jgi:hypothetical protein
MLASQSPDQTHTIVTIPMADISPRDGLKTKGVLGTVAYAFTISVSM